MSYSPWDCKESDTTEGLTLSLAFQNKQTIHTYTQNEIREPGQRRLSRSQVGVGNSQKGPLLCSAGDRKGLQCPGSPKEASGAGAGEQRGKGLEIKDW